MLAAADSDTFHNFTTHSVSIISFKFDGVRHLFPDAAARCHL